MKKDIFNLRFFSYKVLIAITLILLFYCSSSSYRETFVNGSQSTNYTSIFNIYTEKLNEIVQEQREIKNEQLKMLDKLDYITNYKRLNQPNIDNRLSEYDNIENSEDIINELNYLGLGDLYENEISELQEGTINNLDAYKNALKTKYLIDNRIINSDISNEVFEGLEFLPTEPNYPENTTEQYYTDKIIPLIYESIGDDANQGQFLLKLQEIKDRKSSQPEIYIRDQNGEIDKNVNNQIYINDSFKNQFTQEVQEFNIEEDNFNQLRQIIKQELNDGVYIGNNHFV